MRINQVKDGPIADEGHPANFHRGQRPLQKEKLEEKRPNFPPPGLSTEQIPEN